MWIFNKIRRFINQNNFNILFAIIGCAFVIFLIQAFNNSIKEKQKETLININEISNGSTISANQARSPVTQERVANVTLEEHKELIYRFIEYCNNNEIENAYNMLTDDCRKELYPSLNVFKNNYYENIFNEYKMCNIQFWKSSHNTNTYKVKILNDMLSSGRYDSNSSYEDYFTIVKKDNELQLNISSFINKIEINKERTEKAITVTILSKIIYMDYEIYEIKVNNETSNTILIDPKENNSSVYISDNNDVRYSSFITEVILDRLIVKDYSFATIKLRFNKLYNPDRVVNRITFSDIILDYNDYKNFNDKKEYENRTSISIFY